MQRLRWRRFVCSRRDLRSLARSRCRRPCGRRRPGRTMRRIDRTTPLRRPRYPRKSRITKITNENPHRGGDHHGQHRMKSDQDHAEDGFTDHTSGRDPHRCGEHETVPWVPQPRSLRRAPACLQSHVCQGLADATIRQIHWILSCPSTERSCGSGSRSTRPSTPTSHHFVRQCGPSRPAAKERSSRQHRQSLDCVTCAIALSSALRPRQSTQFRVMNDVMRRGESSPWRGHGLEPLRRERAPGAGDLQRPPDRETRHKPMDQAGREGVPGAGGINRHEPSHREPDRLLDAIRDRSCGPVRQHDPCEAGTDDGLSTHERRVEPGCREVSRGMR